jgi:hypothetical protein
MKKKNRTTSRNRYNARARMLLVTPEAGSLACVHARGIYVYTVYVCSVFPLLCFRHFSIISFLFLNHHCRRFRFMPSISVIRSNSRCTHHSSGICVFSCSSSVSCILYSRPLLLLPISTTLLPESIQVIR